MLNHQNQQKSQMGFVKKSYGADVRFSVIYTYRNRNDDRCTLMYIDVHRE